MFVDPEEVDTRLSWRPGTAERLARQRRLPHTLMPNGEVRFVWAEVEALIVRVPAAGVVPAGGPRDAQ